MQQDTSLPKIQNQLRADSVSTSDTTAQLEDSVRPLIDTAAAQPVTKSTKPDSQVTKLITPEPLKESDSKPLKNDSFLKADSLVEKPQSMAYDLSNKQADSLVEASTIEQFPFIPEQSLRPKNSSIWEITTLIICLLLIAFVKALNKRRFGLLIKSFFNSRVVPQSLREENAISNQVIIVLTGTFVLIIALMIYQSLKLWIPEMVDDTFRFYAQVCLFIVLVYIAKFAFLELLAEVVDKYQAIQEYIFNVLLFNAILGIVLLPIILGNALTLELDNVWLVTGLAIIVCAYLYRNWRAIKISMVYKFPVYYIFLYLCTLEILPSIVLIKMFQTQLT